MKTLLNKPWVKPVLFIFTGLLLGWLIFGGSPHNHDHTGEQAAETGNGTIWTCSMHPSIRDDEPGTCPICAMDLIPVTSGDMDDDRFSMVMSEAAVRLAEIQTTPAKLDVPSYHIWAPGTIQADERKLATVAGHYSGRITKLHVDFTGAAVRKGQPLASVYSEELLVAQRELLESYRRRDINPALYRAARQRLTFWELTDAQIDAILEKGGPVREIEILSPVTGVVTERNITLNDYIQRGQTLFRVADLSTVWLLFDVSETDIYRMRTGQNINFTLRSRPGDEREATVTFVEPTLDTSRRTVRVRAEAGNRDGTLRPGMLVSGNVQIDAQQPELLIPASAVLWTGPRSVVYVRDMEADSPRFEAREVTLGSRSGDFYVIYDGISEGEHVVFNGAFKIDSEMQLADKFSMMNRIAMDEGPAHHSDDITRFEDVPDVFRAQLTDVIKLYIEGKDALVASDFEGTVRAFTRMNEKVKGIGEHSLSGTGHQAWMDRYAALTQHGGLLTEANDIEAARTQFRFISDELIKAVRQFGVEGVVYQQYCPMTFDWEGSYWLSTEEQIANPYLPETMLRCGEVIERLE